MAQGTFIVLDGPEGCGKSTQCRLLADWLLRRGRQVLAVRDPGSTPTGERIRAILLDAASERMAMRCEMLLYMAARAQMMSELILPALAEGKIVVCDRFVSSTLAYQGGAEGLSQEDILRVAEVAIEGRWPDLTIILDIEPCKSMARIGPGRDRIERRPAEYHQAVYRRFLQQASAANMATVNADQALETVSAQIQDCVEPLLRAGK